MRWIVVQHLGKMAIVKVKLKLYLIGKKKYIYKKKNLPLN